MFRLTVCGCLSLLVACAAAVGENKNDLKAGQWAGTYWDAQVTLELKAKTDGGYAGTILFQGEKFPLTARGDGSQLSGVFQTDDGSFDFSAAPDGSGLKFTTGGKTYQA